MLYRSSDSRVTVGEEIGHITNYLEIQKIRCGDRLKLRFDIDRDLTSFHIPPMLLLPFVENSIKHGVSTSSAQAHVSITLSGKDGRLVFTITNSRPKRQPKESEPGVGLQNVKKRLTLLFNRNYTLDIRDTAEQYKITLAIPLNNASDGQ